MAASTSLLSENGEYLWLSLLAMGFQPDAETMSYASTTKTAAKRIQLGPSMFVKPNKDALHIVIHFLLEKLNPTRFREAYRNCWPVLTQKADTEFRKVTCAWLREIMDATGGSKVVTSLLLTPGGHKFVQLMLDLAKHVMLQDMRTFSTDESWVPETAETSTSSLDMEMKRFHMVRKRFVRAAVDQDRLLSEYQTEAQNVVKSMRELKAQDANLDKLPKYQSSESVPEEDSLAEKIKKVRSLWSTIDEMLAMIKENQNAIESVLKGEVDQHKLDGTNRVLTIPNVLLERIQQLPHQLKSGNTHEDGELNLLCVMELMNHALQLLKNERCRTPPHTPESQFSSQHLKKQCQQMDRMVEDLTLMREKIAEEEVKFSHAIREQEAVWDQKWMETVKKIPLASFLIDDPADGFLSPKDLNLVEDEDGYKSSDLSHYSKLVVEESEANDIQEDSVLGLSTLKTSAPCPAPVERREETPVGPQTSVSSTSPHQLSNSPPSKPVKTPSAKPSQAAVEKRAHVHSKEARMAAKTNALDMEHENLAEQFADALTAASPPEGNGLKLEDLLDNLQRDPFSTKKQLPRTPESLIVDVRRSWQKALKEDEATKQRTVTFNDHQQKPSPLHEQRDVFSPEAPSNLDSSSIIFPVRGRSSQHKVLQSTLLWDTFNAEGVDQRAVLFSLEHETLPELPSFDSPNLRDVTNSDDEEEQATEVSPPPRQIQQMPQHIRTPECLLSDFRRALADRDSLKEPDAETAPDKVFSLDLDKLQTPSPFKKQENSLPKLLTFSPIDDM
ncbi:unnamed protein product [Ophioblennius macclurei]